MGAACVAQAGADSDATNVRRTRSACYHVTSGMAVLLTVYHFFLVVKIGVHIDVDHTFITFREYV